MRRTRRKIHLFVNLNKAGFELDHDYDLITASFLYAYDIRLRRPGTEMSWKEFSCLLSNLPSDSQLVQVINIRKAEGEELKNFTPGQMQIRDDWYDFIAERNMNDDSAASQLESMFRSIC